MKEAVILGIKDRQGNLYPYDNGMDFYFDTESIYSKPLIKGQEAFSASVVHFPSGEIMSLCEPSKGAEYTYLKVLTDIEVEDINDMIFGAPYKKHCGRVILVNEISNPMEYALALYKESMDIKMLKHVIENWSILGFSAESEFEAFQSMCEECRMSSKIYEPPVMTLSKRNIAYLSRLLDIGFLRLWDGKPYRDDEAMYPLLEDEEIREVLAGLADDKFLAFHEKSGMSLIRFSSPERIDMNFITENILTRPDYPNIILEDILREKIGADAVFRKIFPYFRVTPAQKEIIDGETALFYEDEHYEGEADEEFYALSKILPYVTEESLPLLREFFFDEIKICLPERLKIILESEQEK